MIDERLELGAISFPSGFAHISDPSYIYDDKANEKILQTELATQHFVTVDGKIDEDTGKIIAQTCAMVVPTSDGRAWLTIDPDGVVSGLTVAFADDDRVSNANCCLTGFLESSGGMAMAADLDTVLKNYKEVHVRAKDEAEMPFGYDQICLASARNDKRGSVIRGIAAIAEFGDNGAKRIMPVHTMIEDGETVGIHIDFGG